MRNELGKGHILKNQEGKITYDNAFWITVASVLIAMGSILTMEVNKEKRASKFVMPQGASIVLEPTSIKHPLTLVYEDQEKQKCPGTIEKIVPLQDDNGDYRVLKAVCTPNTAA